jgi:hypothetical protein
MRPFLGCRIYITKKYKREKRKKPVKISKNLQLKLSNEVILFCFYPKTPN